jgi:hypothetical protein
MARSSHVCRHAATRRYQAGVAWPMDILFHPAVTSAVDAWRLTRGRSPMQMQTSGPVAVRLLLFEIV